MHLAGQSPPLSAAQYAGLGVGGARLIFDFGNLLGYTVEGRLGYSFNPVLQLYLSGSIDGELPPIGFRSELIAVFVQYHLYSEPSLGVVARAGIGVALSSSFSTGNNMGPGAAGGLGLEIGLSPGLFLTPELFYKYQSLSPTNGTSAATGESERSCTAVRRAIGTECHRTPLCKAPR